MSDCDMCWRFHKYLGFDCSREKASMVETRRIRLFGRQFLHQRRNSVVLYKFALDYVFQRMGTLLSTQYFHIHVQGVALLNEYFLCARLALCGPPVERLPTRASDI